jgi:tetratricopeptide (TPR) repeat protein
VGTAAYPAFRAAAAPETDRRRGWSTWLQDGIALLCQQRFQAALELLDKGLQTFPLVADGWAYKAWALAGLGRFDEAITAASNAIEIDSNCRQAWLEKAEALCKLERYEEALIAFEQHFNVTLDHARCRPAKGDCWNAYGVTLAHLNRYEDALAAVDKAIEDHPDDRHSLAGRAIYLSHLERYQEALIATEKALGKDPDNAVVWAHQGVALSNLGRYSEAVLAFDHCIEICKRTKETMPQGVVNWWNAAKVKTAYEKWEAWFLALGKGLPNQPSWKHYLRRAPLFLYSGLSQKRAQSRNNEGVPRLVAGWQ